MTLKMVKILEQKLEYAFKYQWDENIKGYRQTALNRGKINTPSSAQVVQPIYQTSIKKWQNYIYQNYWVCRC